MSWLNRPTILFLLFVVHSGTTFSQERNNWWYEDWLDSQWLNFGVINPPTVVQLQFAGGSLQGFLGTMSDPSGNLLLYNLEGSSYNSLGQTITGAATVWSPFMDPSGSVIVPSHAGEKYGVFQTGKIPNGTLDCGFYEVEMSANGGLGEVLVPGALILEYDVLSGVAATPHSNGQDYWVAFHSEVSNYWYLFRYGPTGLDPVPVVSQTGIELYASNVLIQSQIKFSYQGDKLAYQTLSDTLELFEFDDATGIVEHIASLPTPSSSYGLEFSPSGQYLYMITSVADSSNIFQWNVELPPGQIAASRTNVFSTTLTSGNYFVGMALAPDGRIYFPHDVTPYYSRIEYPDLGGAACTVVEDVIGMPPAELTSFINNHCKRYHDSEMSVGLNEREHARIKLWPNPAQARAWLELPGVHGKMQLQWYDALGKMVYEEQRTSTGARMELDVSDLLAGQYFLRVIGAGKVATAKLLIE